jgi:hypothetical protein
MSGRTLDPRRGAGQQIEIRRCVENAGAQQEEIVVVAGHALVRPEVARIRLGQQLAGRQPRRRDALDVPLMEILVAAKPEKVAIATPQHGVADPRQRLARRHQRARRTVFQPAVAAGAELADKQVTGQRRLAVEERALGAADRRQIPRQTLAVGLGRAGAGQHQRVRHAAGRILDHAVRAQFEGMVQQSLVVRGVVVAPSRRRRRPAASAC